MKSIEQLVFSLLQTQECVIIPSFGGFIVKTKSARIDFEKGIAMPPCKDLSFNVKLKDHDGQLINSCSLENKLSYADSEALIQKHVWEWNESISHGNRLHLENIGYFWKSEEGNIQFEQDRSFNFLLSSYGLAVVEFIPASSVETEKEATIIPVRVRKKQLLKYAAAAAIVLPIAFYSYWIPAKTPALESGMISYQDFNPLAEFKQGSYHYAPISLKKLDLPKVEVSKTETVVQNIPNEEPNTSNYQDPSSGPVISPQSMYLVAGCFANIDNATRLVSKMQSLGFDAQLLQTGGLYKVSLASGFTAESLTTIQQKAKEASIECWIFKP
jgi:nucleoid DNA-binding protein